MACFYFLGIYYQHFTSNSTSMKVANTWSILPRFVHITYLCPLMWLGHDIVYNTM